MSNDNMPPGVSVNDIPGNRPEDLAEEAFWDALADKCEEAGLDPELIETVLEDQHWGKIVLLARELGEAAGYAEGRAEGSFEEYLRAGGE